MSIENNSEFGEKLKNVQIFGKGNFIVGEEVKEVLDNFEIKFPSLVEEDETFKDFQGNKAKERFLKVTPERMYFQDSEAFKGRLEISL